MSWLVVLRLLLTLANSVASIVREKQLMDAGEQRAIAKSLVAMVARLKIGAQVEAETAAMSDEELNASLRGDT